MKNLKPIPPPPDPAATVFTKREAAGYLRVRERTIDELRRRDADFVKIWRLIGGQPRALRLDIDRWLRRRPTGWSPSGGLRPGAFGRADATPSAA